MFGHSCSDVRLGDRSGLDVFEDLKKIDRKCLVVFITGHGTADTAIEAMKLSMPMTTSVKPLDVAQLQQVVSQAFQISQQLMHVPAVVEDGVRPDFQVDRLIGSGPAMQAICKKIGRVAQQDVNVLILGESGTGKELVARAIYHHSHRSDAPFLAINCAAIPEALLPKTNSSATKPRKPSPPPTASRIGKFEQCAGGTIFLDEIGDMPAHTQAKILRLLQEKRFERLGGNESIAADVRIVAATNQNLDAMIEQGRFRTDLYYRLRGTTITLPPLRDRREDIAELAHYFLFRHNRRLSTAAQSISQEAMELLENHDWPGNVRELQNTIHEALIAASGPSILPDFLPPELHHNGRSERPAPIELPFETDDDIEGLQKLIESAFKAGETDVYRRASSDYFDRFVILRRHATSLRATNIERRKSSGSAG